MPPAGVASVADPLETVIPLLRPQVVLSKVVSGAGDWSIRKPRYADPSFCLMLAGNCWLSPDGIDPVELFAGDFLLLPETPSFVMASDPALAPTDVELHPTADSHYGPADGPEPMRMLGGYFRFDRANARLLVKLLPPTILIRHDESGSARLNRIVELITDEAIAQRPCREPILERLVEVLLIEACRFRTERPTAGENGLIAGLSDPQLAGALREIHDGVAEHWTVEKLARTANMSRAVFAERFANTIGMPPMQYVLEWRVALAKDMLQSERLSIGEIAARTGYQSASAFTTAFTRVTGRSPREYARGSGD
ncbi:AraC family transcriptional regulator [Mycolicibacterium septicum]|uniref:AraC family transcriptional regulator n=1 Tax=Mycolicibacterium septicum TaxID=98668 RepID=UPI002360BD28|nr:AraC family transcriptional regulator [Mycolicibacterium septicum]